MSGAPVLGLGGRLRKLRAMTPAEVAERLRYRLYLGRERRAHRRGTLAPADRLPRGLVDTLRGTDWRVRLLEARRRHRTRFLPGVQQQETMRGLFAERYADGRAATAVQAARATAGEFAFFGHTFTYPDGIPWQRDPVTNLPWPPVYHADVPIHRGNTVAGDVKHVWELSRHQFLIDLGKSVFLTGSAEHAEAIRSLVRSWRAGNPYATGVNWACALEPAFRSFSWMWAYFLSMDALDDDFHVEWLEGLLDHGRFLYRHLEYFASPYNHLIGEASALYMLGACFPEFSEAGQWRARGRHVLESRLAEQFYEDGGSVEQSTFYHHATIGYYLLAALTARATGDALPPAIDQAIERGLDFSVALSQPDGRTPEIGGADDGKPIRMEHLPFWDFRPYYAIGAVLFERPDLKRAAGRFHEDALWLLGPEGLARFDAMPDGDPRATSVALPHSGYYVMRTDWTDGADYLCMDCGEQAAGMRTDDVPNSMHGHADCLSVVAWLAGRRVLVDSGLFAYNCGGAWEAHFRETAAHNTVRVDGRDQARHIGKMAWSHSYRATCEGWWAGEREAWAIGTHDGYARGEAGVVHRRAVWLRPDGYIVICDELVAAGRHDYEVNFQFAPGRLDVAAPWQAYFDDGAAGGGGVDVLWTGNAAWIARASHGGEAPHEGWIAPSLGVKQAAPRLTLTCSGIEGRTVLLTVLAARAPHASGPRAGLAPLQAGGIAGAVRISTGDGADWCTTRGLQRPDGFDTDALIAICRETSESWHGSWQVGGTYVRCTAHADGAPSRAHTTEDPTR
ncbi:MAG: heparinase II/III family protein [Vicinamibacterales bacterium]